MLKIGGDPAVARELITMLEEAAALGALQPPPQPGEAVKLSKKRSSPTLHRCLRAIIEDRSRHAQVTIATGSAIHFGTFNEWQNLNVANAVHVNRGAPGMGVVIAFHEIWENYISRDGANKRGKYGPAHTSALAVERDIASELSGEGGGRVAAVETGEGKGQGWVLDYETYFLVLTARPEGQWGSGRFDAAIRERADVSEFAIRGLTAGQRVGADRLDEVLTTLREHRQATAKITGQRTGAEEPALAVQRATAVRSAIVVTLNPDRAEYGDEQGTVTLGRDEDSPGSTLGALRAWAGPEQVVDAAPGVTVEISEPGRAD